MWRDRIVVIVLAAACVVATTCRAELAQVPSWLPAEQRFEVEGAGNEIVQAEQALALMRDALHPKLRERMREGDLGRTLAWIAHVTLPSATNDAAYFDTYKVPVPCAALNVAVLTNSAARLAYIPPMSQVRIVYDAPVYYSLSRPEPGVDYPGVEYEDAGSTPYYARIVLQAPKRRRTFRLEFLDGSGFWDELKLKIVPLSTPWTIHFSHVNDKVSRDASGYACLGVDYCALPKKTRAAVFARGTRGYWGPPTIVEVSTDPLSKHHYSKKGLIESIDYDSWRDVYRFDEKDRIIGFERMFPGVARGDDYSHVGEKMVESYAGGNPKTTRKVEYAVEDGKLTYKVLSDDIHYKNETMRFKNY